jgi:hypothetical protein
MRVLVACEYSGRVRDAFTRRGHYAVSCDLLPSDTPGKHYQGDVRQLLKYKWDLLIGFPPCTKLSAIGARYWPMYQEDGSQQEAIDFFWLLAHAKVPRVAIENPAGIMSRLWRKPDQYIQPWWFGDPWIKRTGLWLRNLPLLRPTNEVEPMGHWVDGGTFSDKRKGGGGNLEGAYSLALTRTTAGRAHVRSKTFEGIAEAMAAQWG